MAQSKQMRKKERLQRTRKGRLRTVSIGALNLTMHPHPNGAYIDLLGMAKRSKGSIVLYGKSCARIGVFAPLNEAEPFGPHYGEIHRYINIDVEGNWYDTERGKQADDDDVKKVSIPANLKPEYEPFRFVFFPDGHRLFYEIRAHKVGPLSPAHVQKLLVALFRNERIVSKYGKVDVTIEPAADTVERILAMPVLRKLRIEVNRPNTDDFSDFEREVFERLEAESAQTIQESIVAQRETSLTPTIRTRALCRIAASNGEVEGEGRDSNNKTLRVRTTDYPWTETTQYRSSVTNERDAFLNKSSEMMTSLMRRLRNETSGRQT